MSEPGLTRAMQDKAADEQERLRHAPPAHGFVLRTADMFYANTAEEVEALEALGFDFTANGSPHQLTKIGNPPAAFIIETVQDLTNFIAKHGAVIITPNKEMIVLGGHAVHLKKLTEVGEKIEGYTSIGYVPLTIPSK